MPTPPYHELRRSDHAIVDPEALASLLHAARVGRVGVIADGEPYVVPMNFAYEDARTGTHARIIIHGASQGRLIEALARDARVCVEVDEVVATLPDPVLCEYDTAYASVLCYGRARVLTALGERTAALRVLARKYAPTEEADALKERTVDAFRGRFGAHTAVIDIAIDTITGKQQPVVTSAPRHRVAHDNAAPDLARFGHVPATYRHHARVVTPGDDVALPHGLLKWYEIRRGDYPPGVHPRRAGVHPHRSRDRRTRPRVWARLRHPALCGRARIPHRLRLASHQRAVGNALHPRPDERQRRRLPARPPQRRRAGAVRVGVGARLARTRGLGALPLVGARHRREARLSGRPPHGHGVSAIKSPIP